MYTLASPPEEIASVKLCPWIYLRPGHLLALLYIVIIPGVTGRTFMQNRRRTRLRRVRTVDRTKASEKVATRGSVAAAGTQQRPFAPFHRPLGINYSGTVIVSLGPCESHRYS